MVVTLYRQFLSADHVLLQIAILFGDQVSVIPHPTKFFPFFVQQEADAVAQLVLGADIARLPEGT